MSKKLLAHESVSDWLELECLPSSQLPCSSLMGFMKPHSNHVQFSIQLKVSRKSLCRYLEFSLHNSLFSEALFHKFQSLLSPLILIFLLSSATLSYSAWILLSCTMIEKAWSLAKAGQGWGVGVVELIFFLLPWLFFNRSTPVPFTLTCLEANFRPPLFCLVISSSLLMFSVPSFAYLNIKNTFILYCLPSSISKILDV